MSDFRINDTALDDDTQLIQTFGEIDLYTAPQLKEHLQAVVEAEKPRVIVDLSETAFIDSTTLGVLVGAMKRLRARGGVLCIVCSDPDICKLFQVTGLDQVFTIVQTKEEALAQ
jgi:anti-sigma B factor antagonist